jgi:large subunit ribosomal protein L9
VAELLKAKGFEVDKQSITLPHVKAVGTYDVDIRLYAGVHAKLHIEVAALPAE